MKKYIGEVPRLFTTIEAESDADFKKKLKESASDLADKCGVFEDITGKELPTAKEAITTKTPSLLAKVVNIVETGKSITKATGGSAFLGVSGADIFFGNDLAKDLNLGQSENSFLSFGSFLGDMTKK